MNTSHGLDARYFKEKLSLVIAGLGNYTPDELARELSRLATTAQPVSAGLTDNEVLDIFYKEIGGEGFILYEVTPGNMIRFGRALLSAALRASQPEKIKAATVNQSLTVDPEIVEVKE